MTVSAAFFLGQGGYATSIPWVLIANKVKATGVNVAIFPYTNVDGAARWLTNEMYSEKRRIALCGYSLGVTSATWLQETFENDLVISVAASTYAGNNNHAINHAKTKRSRLFYGDDAFSAGGRHQQYDEETHVPNAGIWLVSHLLLPTSSIVINGVLQEFAKLKGN